MRLPCLLGIAFVAGLGVVGCEAECVGGGGRCGLVLPPRPTTEPVAWTDGTDAPIGSGKTFVFDEFAIADKGQGFDLDGRCVGPGECVDNALWQVGQLGNDQLRQALLGGEMLLILEIAGLDVPFDQDDDEVTVKLYGARDADDPFFPANNFQVPPGETRCCEFLASAESLDENEQAFISVPARLSRGRLSTRFPVSGGFAFKSGEGDARAYRVHPIEAVQLSGALRTTRTEYELPVRSFLRAEDLLIGFAIPAASFATIDNPLCKTLNQLCPRQLPKSSVLDLIASFMQPDADLDAEPGLERLELGASGRLERCLDEQGRVVGPTVDDEPWSCVFDPSMKDGYSVAIAGRAVEATIVGIQSKD